MNQKNQKSLLIKNNNQQFTIKEYLIQQIVQAKIKLQQYQELQLDINEANQHIQNLKNQPINVQDNKNKFTNIKKNTHKKVKIYQLQKKYDKIVNQYIEKESKMLKGRDYYVKLDDTLQQKAKQIQNEKNSALNLQKLQQQIEEETVQIDIKLQQKSQKLQQSNKSKELLIFQRKRLRDQIRKLKMVRMNRTKSELQQELQLSASLSQYQDDNESLSGELVSKTNKQITQRSITSFVKPSFNLNHHRRQATDLSLWLQKQSQRIEGLMCKMDILQQKIQQTSSTFYSIRQEITANQVLVKHHKITTGIAQGQLANYQKIMQRTKKIINDNNKQIEDLSKLLNKQDGQRGFMRGKIGIKIQEQRLIKGVNLLLEQDLQRIRKKLTYLILLKKILREKYE